MKLEISEQSIFSSFTGMVGVNNTIVQNKNCLKYIYVFEINTFKLKSCFVRFEDPMGKGIVD